MSKLSFYILVMTIVCTTVLAADDILIADFEGNDYGNWRITGQAFGPKPAQGTLPNQMEISGYRGKGLVSSYYGGDGTTGKAVSPAFEIQRKFINFLIGGGMNPGQTCMNLIVDGKTVRTATGPNDKPGGSEKLAWAGWDVSDFMGKQAVLEIVDTHTGGWGHINVDHIFQSRENYAAPVPDLKRTITLNKPYLNFPVTTGAPKRLMRMYVGDKLVREFTIEYAETDEQFWVFTETGNLRGQTVTFVLPGDREGDQKALNRITQTEAPCEAKTFYKEKLRPQIHFSSRRGWNNDSNGMVYYKGQYHLFYQHNPYGWAWGNMTWGHAVSPDMIHWRELGDALHPDHLGTIFSGSAVVDHKNTAGFQSGDEKTIVCMYTSAGGTNPWSEGKKFTQSIAYSNDRGRCWTVYEDNPVVEFIADGNRDPKVIWHEPTGQWAMVLYLDGKDLGFFTSKDLKTWEFQSKLVGFFECPELFELPVDGDTSNTKWIVYGATGDYMIGQFDGKKFEPDGDLIRFHYGNCFYASQTFNNIPEEDGRRIQIAWGRVETPGMPFNQCMLFPVELTLHDTNQGPKLFVNPIRELRALHDRTYTWTNLPLPAQKDVLTGPKGELFHIEAEFETGQAKRLGLEIRGVEVAYDVEKRQLSCLDKTAPLDTEDGGIKLEILVDRTTIEIFANDGQVYMPMGTVSDGGDAILKVFSTGGQATIKSLAVHELKSIW